MNNHLINTIGVFLLVQIGSLVIYYIIIMNEFKEKEKKEIDNLMFSNNNQFGGIKKKNKFFQILANSEFTKMRFLELSSNKNDWLSAICVIFPTVGTMFFLATKDAHSKFNKYVGIYSLIGWLITLSIWGTIIYIFCK